ncbi:acetate--CoA ligase [Pelotomaculum terephthalicicum JT]|uniref:acetate--CoA ligase n=1 Tax=Pelotomaculum TaxID=191373 RepID=UPI0009CA0A9B|nr:MULTISPECIES: acetate--CoA ligase [Pelotomaculum]MCG9968024.1 acetate--CoA ligase [Pelotomaculum terephthalicicum JT]OPX87522.1 MAG: Acetyl-coenzyme A synthetase [Pelotomaculum sp. PtaB.Bin117]OPY60634.1 MAG: Acetyl-coenzyme A synthetase [Pelotomaculum sp. PtaU1.Bin065]
MAEMKSMMVENRVFNPSPEFVSKARIKSLDEYKEMYRRSVESPNEFWAQMAEENLTWFKKWESVEEYSFEGDIFVRYFAGGKLNVSYNCLDRHLDGPRRNKAALIWQGEPLEDSKTYTYQQLHHEVCKFANVLKSQGVKRGDRVGIYLPMIPELAIAMLACTRIGAIHCIVFGGFSAEAIRDRMLDAKAEILITNNFGYRSGKFLGSKDVADAAMAQCPDIKKCIVVKRVDKECNMVEGRDVYWDDLMAEASHICEPEAMDSEDPLFILYTSGSTGKPKGVMHTTAGYHLYAMMTVKYFFDIRDEDVYFCTADIGWVTGHSYCVYGPLGLGATSVIFEGVPSYPEPDRFWQIVEKYGVNVFYTAPTAIRAMMKDGDQWPNGRDLSSLRLLASVGEPINPEAWMWYYTVIGKEKCPIVDTWWQTETGGHLIAPMPGAHPMKPGSAVNPFFGVVPALLTAEGKEAGVNEGGHLCMKKPWPGIMRGVYGDPNRFKETYFVQQPGYYFSGDGARKDEDGYYWLLGRVDDVINVSGHRMGTAEVESALVAHPTVAEAAVVGFPHDIKGEGIYAYVTLKEGVEGTDALKKELVAHVRKEIGPIASPDKIQFAPGMPKTRSGKIMRRILRKIAAGAIDELGDTSTLADSTVVDNLVANRQ